MTYAATSGATSIRALAIDLSAAAKGFAWLCQAPLFVVYSHLCELACRRVRVDVHVDIDEELLREFDQAARAHRITRSVAVRGAITTWLSQARRDAALREMFDTEYDSGQCGEDR